MRGSSMGTVNGGSLAWVGASGAGGCSGISRRSRRISATLGPSSAASRYILPFLLDPRSFSIPSVISDDGESGASGTECRVTGSVSVGEEGMGEGSDEGI